MIPDMQQALACSHFWLSFEELFSSGFWKTSRCIGLKTPATNTAMPDLAHASEFYDVIHWHRAEVMLEAFPHSMQKTLE